MFEQFTDEARQVVVLAQEEARLLDHEAIGAEHLLLGLLRDEDGAAVRALRPDVTLTAARARVASLAGSSGQAPAGQIPFTTEAEQALEQSVNQARDLGHEHVAAGHLLLGLLNQSDSLASRVIAELGADPGVVRPRVLELAGEDVVASGIRSWTGSDPMSDRMARARARVQAERDRAAEKGPGGWEVLAHAGAGALRALAAARRHAADGLRGELTTVDLVVGVLAVGDPAVTEALAEAGAEDVSPARLAPGYREGAGGDGIVVALSGQARRSCSMAARLVADEGACVTPAHLLLAAFEMLGPVRAAIAAERLGADEAALRPALLSRILHTFDGPTAHSSAT